MSEPESASLSFNAALVLQGMTRGHRYGFELMKVTGLPSGTVYPILARLEATGLVRSRWENEERAHGEGRPRRRYYETTGAGEVTLQASLEKLARQSRLFGDALRTGSPVE